MYAHLPNQRKTGTCCNAQVPFPQARNCPLGSPTVLAAALQHADLAVAEWLLEAVPRARPDPGDARAAVLLTAAAAAAPCDSGVAKLQWLEARGILPQPQVRPCPLRSALICQLPVLAGAAVVAGTPLCLLGTPLHCDRGVFSSTATVQSPVGGLSGLPLDHGLKMCATCA